MRAKAYLKLLNYLEASESLKNKILLLVSKIKEYNSIPNFK